MNKNKLVIAVAGSGKTTYLVDEALKKKSGRVLITTFTLANEAEIKKKIISKTGCIPENITVQTWFSFLLQHGVRPFQGILYEGKIKGMILVNSQSGVKSRRNGFPIYYKENEVEKHYISAGGKIFSDKIAKFTFRCNKETGGWVIDRLSRIYTDIFIDEAQDLAGYDLEILKLLFKTETRVFLVGDPRQTVYLTHHSRKHKKNYSEGRIKEFIEDKCKSLKVEIDEISQKYSHRNNATICSISSQLYPELPLSAPCNCEIHRQTKPPEGIFLVRKNDVHSYLEDFRPMQLRLRSDSKWVDRDFSYMNFGVSKGLSFDRVLIFPTENMLNWIYNHQADLKAKTRAQLYVALTRARHSVGIVCDFDANTTIDGIHHYIPN